MRRLSVGRLWRAFALFSMLWLTSSILCFFFAFESEGDGWRLHIKRLMTRRRRIAPGDNCTINKTFDNVAFLAEQQLREWYKSEFHYCSHNLFVVPSGFARLYNVIVDPSKAHGRMGGEEIGRVMNQPERLEYWSLGPGTFRLLCPEKTSGTRARSFVDQFFNLKTHLTSQYLTATTTIDEEELQHLQNSHHFAKDQRLQGRPVMAVTRYEYANLYHTVTYLYNIFTNAIYYEINPNNLTILLIDGHPTGALDSAWATLFSNVVRIGELETPQFVHQLVWTMMGYDSPMFANRQDIPLNEEFREFVLSRHGIVEAKRARRICSHSRVVFILRHDYVAHPRNPNGQVMRKIANEEEILKEVRNAFPQLKLNVTAVTMEDMTFRQQLEMISETRVLIGMHGAGLTHAMFLPKWSGLIELFPRYGGHKNVHFRSIARWRVLAYERWVNNNQRLEQRGFRTKIPRGLITNLLGRVLRQLGCPTK